jgi:mannonate dehydratase
MIESWRSLGPEDPVSLDDVRQTGVSHVVSALHHIPIGDVWPIKEIKKYQKLIEEASSDENKLTRSVVESIPIYEDIKLGLPDTEVFIKNWIQTIENLSKCGIKTICYNFMPVLALTRTDLNYKLSSGAYSLSFNNKMLAVFVALNFVFITLNEMGKVAGMKALAERLGEHEEIFRRYSSLYT